MPEEVDFRVLSTFFELYSATLQLVVFKLFLLAGLTYPPTATRKEAEERQRQAAKNEAAIVAASAAREIPREIPLFSQGPWGVSGWRYPILRARRIRESGAGKEGSVDKAAEKGPGRGEEAKGAEAGRGNPEAEVDVDQTVDQSDEEETVPKEDDGESNAEGEVHSSGESEDSDDGGSTASVETDGSDDESGAVGHEEGELNSGREKRGTSSSSRNKKGVTEEKKSEDEEASSVCGVQPHCVQRLFEGAVVFLNRYVQLAVLARKWRSPSMSNRRLTALSVSVGRRASPAGSS